MTLSGMLWTHPYMIALPVQMYTSCVVHDKSKIIRYLFIVCMLCSLPFGTRFVMVCIAWYVVMLASSQSGRCNWVLHCAGWLCVVILWQQEFPR